MKKFVLVLGFGLSIILAGCSSNPGPISYLTLPPGNTIPPIIQATPTAMWVTVAVPDMCQFLTRQEATEILGLVSNITISPSDSTNPSQYNNFVYGTRYYSDCDLEAADGFGGAQLIGICSSQVLENGVRVDPSFEPNWLEGRRQYLITDHTPDPNAGAFFSVEPITDVGSGAILMKNNHSDIYSDKGNGGGAEVDFIVGSWTSCTIFSSSGMRTGTEQAIPLVALAERVAEAIYVPAASSSATVTATPIITPAPSVSKGGTPYMTFRLEEETWLGIHNSLIDTVNACNKDKTCEAAAAARILTNDKNFVAWLNANPPLACYTTFYADLLQALNGEITEMNYVVSGNFDAAQAMVTAQNALLDKVSSDSTTAATACSS